MKLKLIFLFVVLMILAFITSIAAKSDIQTNQSNLSPPVGILEDIIGPNIWHSNVGFYAMGAGSGCTNFTELAIDGLYPGEGGNYCFEPTTGEDIPDGYARIVMGGGSDGFYITGAGDTDNPVNEGLYPIPMIGGGDGGSPIKGAGDSNLYCNYLRTGELAIVANTGKNLGEDGDWCPEDVDLCPGPFNLLMGS